VRTALPEIAVGAVGLRPQAVLGHWIQAALGTQYMNMNSRVDDVLVDTPQDDPIHHGYEPATWAAVLTLCSARTPGRSSGP
jgi:hypothetical protein